MPKRRLFRYVVTVALLAASRVMADDADFTGAGASFPAALYAEWARAYRESTGKQLVFHTVGSQGGIRNIIAKTVDFGASDMPLEPDQLAKEGLLQFPAVIGGIVPVANLPDVKAGDLRLTGPLLADIYLGKIRKWNHPAIEALNPSLVMPDRDIVVIRRSDGSGTTFILTHYLSKVSPEWRERVGTGGAVQWPIGRAAKGNEGVSAYVRRVPASIGYLDHASATKSGLPQVSLRNATGRFVMPNESSFKAAAANSDWTASEFHEILTDQAGENAWPITGASFILMHKTQQEPARATEVLRFFDWSFREGAGLASELSHVPLPAPLIELIQDAWTSIRATGGEPIWPPSGNSRPASRIVR